MGNQTDTFELDFNGLNTDFNLRSSSPTRTEWREELDEDVPTPSSAVPFDGEQDSGIDEAYFSENAEQLATDATFLDENINYIAHLSENGFVETAARLYLIAKGAERALGMIMWKRLREIYGFEKAKESKERNFQIWQWAAKIDKADDRLQYRLDKFIRDAMARELEPEVENLSVTAGDEISRGISSGDEDVVRETISERVDAVKSLDPTLESTTDAVRATKQLEQNGNRQPKLLQVRAIDTNPTYREYTILASIRTGATADENGILQEEYELLPVLSVVLEEPRNEEHREQFQTWHKILRGKLGKYEAYYEFGGKDADEHAEPEGE